MSGFDIHESARVSPLADLEPSVRGSRLVIGERSSIDAFVKIKFAGGAGDIVIGRDCRINSGCVLYGGNGISMGNDVLIAANCTFVPADHACLDADVPIRLQGFLENKGGVVIEDDVWIGAGSILLDGTRLRRGCVVEPGTVVRGEVPTNAIIAGDPWRIVDCRRSRTNNA